METPQIEKVRRNYKSDLNFLLRLKDGNGNVIGWPDYDWTAKFWTSMKVNAVTASCVNGEATNCFNDNGVIHIVLNNHKLSPGKLQIEFTAELPNGIYEDGHERIVEPLPLDIELIREAAPCPKEFEIEMILPYIKGEPFTYEDFTAEQIAELQRPATEAAQRADEATAAANTATQEANEATTETRAFLAQAGEDMAGYGEAEAARAEAEKGRVTAETAREEAERLRVDSEREREQAEQGRKAAEAERQEKARYGSYTIDFGETSTQASDFNLCGDISVEQLTMLNISSLTVANGDTVIEFTSGGFEPFTIRDGANASWQIVREADGQQAAIGVKYKVIS